MVEGVKADYIPIGPEQRLEPAEQQNWHRGRGCRGGRERGAYKERKRKKTWSMKRLKVNKRDEN